MARGREKHQARLDAINLCGKDLARRAKRKCELCEEADDPRPYDAAPDDEPSLDTLILLCARCRGVADGAEADPRTLRFLETAVWNEHSHVAAKARELLAGVDAQWARDTLDMLG
jgi:protein PhnA